MSRPYDRASGSKRPRSAVGERERDYDYDYDYYGTADWYGGGADPYGPPSAGAARDPYYDRAYNGASGGGGSGRDRYAEEWEAYYREREWEEYYARRGGAPPADARGDYDLRNRIGGMADPREERRSSASGMSGPPAAATGGPSAPGAAPLDPAAAASALASALPDPLEGDQLLSFRAYVQYHRSMNKASEPSGDPGADYVVYRERTLKRSMWKFCETHQHDQWFIERYSPAEEHVRQRAAWRRAGRQGRKEQWIKELQEGKLDKISFDVHPNKAPKSQSAQQPASANGEAGTDAAAAEGSKDAKEGAAEEGAADKDAEEASKDKSAGAEGDPKADSKTNGTEAIGPEKNGSASDRRRGGGKGFKPWRMTTRLGEDHELGKEQLIPPNPHGLIVHNLAADMSRAEVERLFRSHAGASFLYLAVGEPREGKKWSRVGYACFDEGADLVAIKEKMCAEKVGETTLSVTLDERSIGGKVHIAPDVSTTARRLKHDLQRAKELLEKFETEDRELVFAPVASSSKAQGGDGADEQQADDAAEGLPEAISQNLSPLIEERASSLCGSLEEALAAVPDDDDVKASGEALEAVRKTLRTHLDLHIDALRQIYATDYYTGISKDFYEELYRRVPISGRRQPATPIPEPAKDAPAPEWCKGVDQRISMLLRPADLDVAELGGRTLEAELEAAAAPYINEEDKDKHRCTVPVDGAPCGKRFVAPSFVLKHIKNKHKAFLDELATARLEKVEFFNNYVLDAGRPQPQAREVGIGGNGGNNFNFNISPPQMMAMMAQMMSGQMDPNMMQSMMAAAGPPPGKRARREKGEGGGRGGSALRGRISNRRNDRGGRGGAEPLPSGGPVDPRASQGRRSYHDLDGIPAAEKDVELQY